MDHEIKGPGAGGGNPEAGAGPGVGAGVSVDAGAEAGAGPSAVSKSPATKNEAKEAKGPVRINTHRPTLKEVRDFAQLIRKENSRVNLHRELIRPYALTRVEDKSTPSGFSTQGVYLHPAFLREKFVRVWHTQQVDEVWYREGHEKEDISGEEQKWIDKAKSEYRDKKENTTLLHYAITENNHRFLEEALKIEKPYRKQQGVKDDPSLPSLLYTALSNSNSGTMVPLLIEHGERVRGVTPEGKPLITALFSARYNTPNTIKTFLNAGANPFDARESLKTFLEKNDPAKKNDYQDLGKTLREHPTFHFWKFFNEIVKAKENNKSDAEAKDAAALIADLISVKNLQAEALKKFTAHVAKNPFAPTRSAFSVFWEPDTSYRDARNALATLSPQNFTKGLHIFLMALPAEAQQALARKKRGAASKQDLATIEVYKKLNANGCVAHYVQSQVEPKIAAQTQEREKERAGREQEAAREAKEHKVSAAGAGAGASEETEEGDKRAILTFDVEDPSVGGGGPGAGGRPSP